MVLFLIFAFCFNILPPTFTFTGGTEVSGEGSLFNQVFWIGVLALSISTVLNNKKPIGGIVFQAMPLVIFCALFVVSSFWSLATDITFRRSILELIVIANILISVSMLKNTSHAFVILYRVASITILFECTMLFRANGFDEVGLFRGIHAQKNVLGLVGAISILAGIWIRTTGASLSKYWNTAYLLGWFSLLMISQSKTSLGLILLAPAIALGLRRLGRNFGVGVGIPLLVIFGLAYSVFAITFISGIDVGHDISNWIHRIGFTGRDGIWNFLIARFLERPWLGYGYGGFWDIGANAPNVRYGIGFITQINQAHNGYLDLLLALGVLGFATYLYVVIGFVTRLSAAERVSQNSTLALCWVFFVFSLLHNLTETTLARGYSLVWVVQLVAMAITYRMAFEAKGAR